MNPIERAMISLEGLSVGDAFGQQFFGHVEDVISNIECRNIPATPWHITDDSIMAIALFEILQEFGQVNQERLAERFAAYYQINPSRGYGGTAHRILQALNNGENWKSISRAVFDGKGSHGNGAAMRIAPLGAFFSDDIDALRINAILSAEITHSNVEGQMGALAVALASAWMWNNRLVELDDYSLLSYIYANIPESDTRNKIGRAINLPFSYSIETAVSALGNGTAMSSQDTVPFCLWVASRHFNNYEEAIWSTVRGLGDRDTTCAIVGGILAMRTGLDGIPSTWRQRRESLDNWQNNRESWW
ncbi:MAG: ADP-ribosylglycohydrolase family protein [Zavarzinella sp.]